MDKKDAGTSQELAYALDMVAVFSRMDLVMVPRQPSLSMIEAGALAGDVSAATVARIYAAMTSADV